MLFPRRKHSLFGLVAVGALTASGAIAQTAEPVTLNTFNMPGIVTMPIATPLDDAAIVSSLAIDDSQRKYTFTFQITPRLTGAFRYSIVDDFRGGVQSTFDRSFDVQYKLVDETNAIPAVAIGLRDFMGTGLYSGEYFVASKQITPSIVASAGIGWGALGTRNGFANPLGRLDDRFDERARRTGQGGELSTTQWFRGDAAFFGGLSWQMDDKLAFALEYSSDAQDLSSVDGRDDAASAINVAVSYALRPDITLGLQYLQGDTIGASAHFGLNPRHPPGGGDRSPAPVPFALRDGSAQSWAGPVIQDAIPEQARTPALTAALATEGLVLQGIALTPNSVLVQVQNNRFDVPAQAIGRTARLLSLIMPADIAKFDIELMQNGMPLSRVTLQRSDLERLEYQPDFINRSLAAAVIGPAEPSIVDIIGPQTRLTWGIGPYIGLSFFDPDDPLRADLGVEATASYDFTQSLSVSGALRGKVIGNRDQSTRESTSVLPRVRSEQPRYDRDGTIGIERLTIDHFGKIGTDIYTRASLGYLEEMFGGVSGELLWKPVDSRLALGAEINAVMQRDTDKLLGFGDYDYGVTTGHVSAYYAFEQGIDLQVDVGRYLAGDWGTTISLDRRFGNGWVIGAFATFTDVSFEDFGEGSFDKGIRVSVPISWALGQPSLSSADLTLRSLQRDGGARLDVSNRIYQGIRGAHADDLTDQWGRFWR